MNKQRQNTAITDNTFYRGALILGHVWPSSRDIEQRMQSHTYLIFWIFGENLTLSYIFLDACTRAGSGGQETDIKHAEFTSEKEKHSQRG